MRWIVASRFSAGPANDGVRTRVARWLSVRRGRRRHAQRLRRLRRRSAQRYCAETCTEAAAARVNEACRPAVQTCGADLRCRRALRAVCRQCQAATRGGARPVRRRYRPTRSSPVDDASLVNRRRPGPPCPVYRVAARVILTAEAGDRPVSGIADASVCHFSFGSLSRARGRARYS